MKKGRNDLVQFLIGIIMLAAGLYWFMSSVTVSTGFYTFRVGPFSSGGLVVIPFIVGIFWIFFNPDSFLAKIITIVGVVLILASIIIGTRFIFHRRSLYEYLIMLVFIVGGGAITARILFTDRTKK